MGFLHVFSFFLREQKRVTPCHVMRVAFLHENHSHVTLLSCVNIVLFCSDLQADLYPNSETVLLCQMCNAIAQGYMQPWIPALPPPTAPATPSKDKSEKTEKAKGRQSGKGTKGGPSKGSLQTVVVDPEATPDLKQALEVRVASMWQ